MRYQARGFQVSFLVHAVFFLLFFCLSRSVVPVNRPIMLDFSILQSPASSINASPVMNRESARQMMQKPSPPLHANQNVAVNEVAPQVITKSETTTVIKEQTVQTAPTTSDLQVAVSAPVAGPIQDTLGKTGGQGSTTAAGNNRETTGGLTGSSTGLVEFGSSSGPSFLHREQPMYPPVARRMNKEARVLLRLTIDEKGLLVRIETVEDPGYGFAEAAETAARRSTFAPARRDGKPVMVTALLPVRFVLKKNAD